MLRINLALCAFIILPAAATGQSAVDRAAQSITEASVRRHVNIIAHDSMKGRSTPSRGLELTASYIAGEFRRIGLVPAGDSGSFLQRFPLPRVRSDSGAVPRPDPTAPNVAGILTGTDPVLRSEYIVFSAHMDHLGVRSSSPGDSIMNGADDDASGTAAVLELARAFSQPGARPKRSLIFLTVSGEERGLLGSAYFTANPPVPIRQMVANLNLDMIGRNWRDTIAAIGREHSDLGLTLDRVAAAHADLNMAVVDDLWPQQSFFFRSDHFNFARRGVPALFFFNGTHADYHQPSDSPEKIDAEKEARIVRLVFYLGREIGNASQRPKWRPGSYEKIVEKKFR